MNKIGLILTVFLLCSGLPLQAAPSAPVISDQLKLSTGFHLVYKMVISDVRPYRLRKAQLDDYIYDHGGCDKRTENSIMSLSTPRTLVEALSSTPGGILCSVREQNNASNRVDVLLAYNARLDESYFLDRSAQNVTIFKGFAHRRIPYIVEPGVGLYREALFVPADSATPSFGVVQGYSDVPTDAADSKSGLNRLPAQATIAMDTGVAKCLHCRVIMNGNPLYDWAFDHHRLYNGHWIAGHALCASYDGMLPENWPALMRKLGTVRSSIYLPGTTVDYTLISADTPTASEYGIQSLLSGASRNTSIDDDRDAEHNISFWYAPNGGDIDTQIHRARILSRAIGSQTAAGPPNHSSAGIVLLALIALVFIGLFVWKRSVRPRQ